MASMHGSQAVAAANAVPNASSSSLQLGPVPVDDEIDVLPPPPAPASKTTLPPQARVALRETTKRRKRRAVIMTVA
jgi:hypothetical protein